MKQLARVSMQEPLQTLDITEIVKHIKLSDVEAYVQRQFYGELDCPLTHKRMACKLEELSQRLKALGYIIVNYSFIDSDKCLQNFYDINPAYADRPHANNLWRIAKNRSMSIADLTRAVEGKIPYYRMGRLYRGDVPMSDTEKKIIECYLDTEVDVYY